MDADGDGLAAAFEEHRDHLRAVAYRLLGRLRVVLALTVDGAGRVTAIDVIADPDRLRRLRLALLPDQPRVR